MDQRSKGKQVEKPRSIHSGGEGNERIRSITELNARASDRQNEIEQHGPNLLTGEGMDSQQFLAKLEGRNDRPKWKRAWDHVPVIGGDTSRETIVKEFIKQAHERIQRIQKLAEDHPGRVDQHRRQIRVRPRRLLQLPGTR